MQARRKVLMVIMDGVGHSEKTFGNALSLAHTPNMQRLATEGLMSTLKAHGPYVGLPSTKDMGNSEVGHNILGAGRVFSQGASLVEQAIKSKSLFQTKAWQQILSLKDTGKTLHFIGLLSDGGVHSQVKHLFVLLEEAVSCGLKKIRLHLLFDGRDVQDQSSHHYLKELEAFLTKLRQDYKSDLKIASGGGRMFLTMDRYGADWQMVKRGWEHHVLGQGDFVSSAAEAIERARQKDPQISDQYLPGFIVAEDGKACGSIEDGDGVIAFNFRGDRMLELCQAFEDEDFPYFDRQRRPKVFFAGMLEYDPELKTPKNFLLAPPRIQNTLSEHLCRLKIRQFACSETQKFGHVTYFWNGNKSGYFDQNLEEYLEIPSDPAPFDKRPWMKAEEITVATISRMQKGSFDFGRINFANGDMVAHSGLLEATVLAVSVVDLMLGQLLAAAEKYDYSLIVTADHGNCDEMFIDGNEADYPQWQSLQKNSRPQGKTSHSLAAVPFYIWGKSLRSKWQLSPPESAGLSQVAATVLELMGLEKKQGFDKSLLLPVTKK